MDNNKPVLKKVPTLKNVPIHSGSWSLGRQSTLKNEPLVHVVSIFCHKAENLKKADTFGLSDPYLSLSIEEETKKTQIIKKTLNPIWNELITFTFNKVRPTKMKITCWDWNMAMQSDFIGDKLIDLNPYFESPKEDTFKLDNVEHGVIFLRIAAFTTTRLAATCNYFSSGSNKVTMEVWKCSTCDDIHCCTPCMTLCHKVNKLPDIDFPVNLGHKIDSIGEHKDICQCGSKKECSAIPRVVAFREVEIENDE